MSEAPTNGMPEDFDVVILGAGINGAGLFRDLCEQGVRCLIVDKGDYGSGTSAAPSRLIHGGIKYLETGEFGLVRQSTLERNLLLRNAPHAVHPLPTIIPIFSWTKGAWAALRTLFGSTTAPRSRGAAIVKIGMAMYDIYGAKHRVMPRHTLYGKGRALKEMPALTPRIVAAGRYYDAWIARPERLVYELVADGLAAMPRSMALNDTALTGVDGDVLHLKGHDGAAHAVRPRIVVNAAGPWIDTVNAALGAPSRLIGGTKGSHILLDHDELVRMLDGRMIYFEADDGRICLVYDYLGRALVGSTDIPAANPDTVRCDDAEIDYLLASLSALLPKLSFSRAQIVYAYSGIRPLPASDATNPGLISRDHSAPVDEPSGRRSFPIVSLVGGKWTTFRGFAEEVADTVLGRLGRTRQVSTQSLPIGGGRDFPASDGERQAWIDDVARKTGLRAERVGALLSRYGTTAADFAAAEAQQGDARLPDSADYSLAEIGHIARNEHVRHLADIVMRRTTLAVCGTLTMRDLETVADIAGAALGWSDATRASEVAELSTRLTRDNQMRLSAIG